MAHAAAVSIIEAPTLAITPLVFFGSVGTGKTHLLEGIHSGLRESRANWRVCYVTSEEFTNQFVYSVRNGKLHPFRKRFRDCDALLIDDLQFLATKRATQEEFLHTFDVLLSRGKLVVLSCDCHPRLAGEYSPELTDRLLGGAIWSLDPPEAQTRLGILRHKSRRFEPPVPEEVLHHLAEHISGNVRELEGVLHSLAHLSRVQGHSADLTMAKEIAAQRCRHLARAIGLEELDRAVCKVFQLSAGVLQSRRRDWSVSHPRMLAMFLARKHSRAAYSEIGEYFGKMNHSTVIAAVKRIRGMQEKNEELLVGSSRLAVSDAVQVIERELQR